MKVGTANRTTMYFSYLIGIIILILFSLNFYMTTPHRAAENIIKEAFAGNSVYELNEEQLEEIQAVLYGGESYNFPAFVMEFNRQLPLKEGLYQTINIEVRDVKIPETRGTSSYQAIVRVELKEELEEDLENSYSGLIVLSIDRVSMRRWRVMELQTLPLTHNT